MELIRFYQHDFHTDPIETCMYQWDGSPYINAQPHTKLYRLSIVLYLYNTPSKVNVFSGVRFFNKA